MADTVAEGLPEQAPNDLWSAHLPGQELVPAYLVSRFAAQYRVIVDVLLAAQDTSLTGLSFDEVGAAVRDCLQRGLSASTAAILLADEHVHLDARLEQLERWQVVTRWQEPARTGEDFLRRRDRYQLTPLAARLHAFWSSAYDADEEEAGNLTLAPRAIHDRLVARRTRGSGRRTCCASRRTCRRPPSGYGYGYGLGTGAELFLGTPGSWWSARAGSGWPGTAA